MVKKRYSRIAVAVTVSGLFVLGTLGGACSNNNPTKTPPTTYPTPSADPITDGSGNTLKTFAGPVDPGAGGFVITISGEVNAIVGYPFPPFDPSQTWMVDGWNWKIEKYIVVVNHVTLWADPNLSPSDQSQHGPQVAHADGPYVVDLHKGGSLPGMGGGGEQALALTTITNQNDNGGKSFDPSTAYGFGFSTVPAPGDGSAINVNLDASEQSDYQLMVQKGYSVYYAGTATWAGDQSGSASGFPGSCTQTSVSSVSTDAGADSGDGGSSSGGYDFTQLPQTMTFQLGFSTPTNYVNCINYTVSEQTNSTVRGVQASTNQSVFAQITVHMDHPFWESFAEDSPVHWDQIAAQYIGVTNPIAKTEDLVGVPFSPFTDKLGNVMPWRNCAPPSLYTPPGTGAMSFDTLSVPQNPQGVCTGPIGVDFASTQDNCPAIRDYYDFIRYTQSTQGHLNSQGLCYIDRQFPSPAGGS